MIRLATIQDSHPIGQIHVEGWRAAYRGILPDGLLAGLSVESRAAGWRRTIEKVPWGARTKKGGSRPDFSRRTIL